MGVGAVAGAMTVGGAGSAGYVLNHAQTKFSGGGYLKHLAVYSLAAVGSGIGALTTVGGYLGIAAPWLEPVVEGAVEGGMVATAMGVGDVALTPRLQTVCLGGWHLLKCVSVGAVAGGAASGIFMGSVGGGGSMSSGTGIGSALPVKIAVVRNTSAASGALAGGTGRLEGISPKDFGAVEIDTNKTLDTQDSDSGTFVEEPIE